MEKTIKELKKTYPEIRYSNLIKGRKNEWWFTISSKSFLEPYIYLMLIDRIKDQLTILKIIPEELQKIIPRRENVYLAGQYDLYFFLNDNNLLKLKFITEEGYIEQNAKNNIVEIRDINTAGQNTEYLYIENMEDLKDNLLTIETYIGNDFGNEEKDFALSLIQKGKNFIAYKVHDEIHFAPSRFVGYKANDIEKHIKNKLKDGKETTPIIDRISKTKLSFDSEIEDSFLKYCKQLGIAPYQNKRKYWAFDFTGSYFEKLANRANEEYLEGQLYECKHKRRERNRKLVNDAKRRFKEEHEGLIFCEICNFNFIEVYGIDYIEVHHLKAVSEMKPGETTNLDDVCLVCPNCHRAIHSEYPYLTPEKIRFLLDKKQNKGKDI